MNSLKLLLSLCLTLTISCEQAHKSKDKEGTSTNGLSESTTTEISSSSNSYRYFLSESGCETGEHLFTSIDAMCKGLQDSPLNKMCALELRKQFFEENCSGQSFIEITNRIKESPNFQKKILQEKTVSIDVVKYFSKYKSTLTIISCLNYPNTSRNPTNNEIMLLKGSEIMYKRDLEYKFNNGSTIDKTLAPIVITECNKDSPISDEELAQYQTIELKVGDYQNLFFLFSPNHIDVAGFSCVDDLYHNQEDLLKNSLNGIVLKKGSKLLNFVDPYNGQNETFSIISCE